jgi:transcriptional accessory protein Tex/SPT6
MQVLAVNRGESLKVLSVKINIPDGVLHQLMEFCDRNWVFKGILYPLRKRLIEQSVKDSYARLSKFMNAQYVGCKKINSYLEWSFLWTLLGYQKGM